ncbi:MAG: D-alanyl-D-alanine carboxypeptidase/D-alanyl-D-alanine-endopeptidase [Prolixibacteraceae bacterium]|jgi:D-alanyl-D-alanine carboxypeptidase/D-alanyl-D-alanine-endopeptidase (penicillin-binding protein 4)|nr:D-alanyl-D-alanine carboxypeptidase/D-alanyl-D-alanine-endopeptidase [Prolixibacteraceae bacterium]
MKQLLFILLLLISTHAFSQTDSSQLWLYNFLNDEAASNSPVSLCVSNTSTNEVLLDENADLTIIPASTLKLITSAAALEILGADFTFKTQLFLNGEVVDSTLYGNIIIKGGGDPTLGSAYLFGANKGNFLANWANTIKAIGIDSIHGNIIVDPSIYSDQDVPQTWIWEDLGNYFGAAAQGISLYDNTFRIVFETDSNNGGDTKVIGTEPYIPELELKNEVKASSKNRDNAYVYGSTFDNYRIVKGTLPMGREKFSIKASIPNPSLLLAHEFRKALLVNNVNITGELLKSTYSFSENDSLLITWKSPQLHKIVKQLNYESVNLFAEHLCKHIGLKTYGEGTTNKGTKAIKEFWKNKGINTDFIFLADGSGLSRANAISSNTLVEVLNYMQNESSNSEYYKLSIPFTGMQGTQKYYFQHSFLKGKAQAKSGSMTRVRSFAGYMTTHKGTPISFAIIINNFNCGSFEMASKLEKLIEGFYSTY